MPLFSGGVLFVAMEVSEAHHSRVEVVASFTVFGSAAGIWGRVDEVVVFSWVVLLRLNRSDMIQLARIGFGVDRVKW